MPLEGGEPLRVLQIAGLPVAFPEDLLGLRRQHWRRPATQEDTACSTMVAVLPGRKQRPLL